MKVRKRGERARKSTRAHTYTYRDTHTHTHTHLDKHNGDGEGAGYPNDGLVPADLVTKVEDVHAEGEDRGGSEKGSPDLCMVGAWGKRCAPV